MKEQAILHTELGLRLGLKPPAFSKHMNFTNTAFGRSQYNFTELVEKSTVSIKYKLLILHKNKDLVRGSTNTHTKVTAYIITYSKKQISK